MQISAISSVTATPSTDHHLNQAHAAKTADAGKASTDAAPEPVKREFTPAPPLRPNIQDLVDINRVLIAMRGL